MRGTADLWPARREFEEQPQARGGGGIRARQLVDPVRDAVRTEAEVAVDAGDEGRLRLVAELRPRERRVLRLPERDEVDLAELERERRGKAEDGRRRGDEQRVLLVAHGHVARLREERVRVEERDAAKVVVHRVVGTALEHRAVVEGEPLRKRAQLVGAERDAGAVAAAVGLVAQVEAKDRLRMLGRIEIDVRRGVDRIVRRIPQRLGEPGARERLQRRKHEELVGGAGGERRCSRSRRGRHAVAGIARSRPESVVHVECSRIPGLRDAEELEERGRETGLRLLLVERRAGHDRDSDAATLHVGAAHAVDVAQLAVRRRVAGLHLSDPRAGWRTAGATSRSSCRACRRCSRSSSRLRPREPCKPRRAARCSRSAAA